MMKLVETLIKNLSQTINKDQEIKNKNNITINFKNPFKKISIMDSIKEHTGFDISKMNKEKLIKIAQKMKIDIKDSKNKSKIIDNIFSQRCEKHCIQPTFITDYPIEMCPLSKKHRNKIGLSERFELFIDGKEICNAYSELNDPIEQVKRFHEQYINNNKKKHLSIDEDFIKALEFGMPPTAGVGIGIERLVMIMTEQSSIQDVLFFPQMK